MQGFVALPAECYESVGVEVSVEVEQEVIGHDHVEALADTADTDDGDAGLEAGWR